MRTGLRVEGMVHRRGRRAVLRGVDLQVEPGEIAMLVGENGAGKTTVLSTAMGLLTLHGGQVLLRQDGRDQEIGGWPPHRRALAGIGHLPQHPTVFRALSALDNVRMALEIHGGRGPGLEARALALLDRLGVAELAPAKAGRLSGGERRRVELARALALEPRVLLADEPFAGIDPRAVAAMGSLFRALAEGGVAVLITDHRPGLVRQLADRLIVLNDGVVLRAGPPDEVMADPDVRISWLGEAA